MKMTPEDFYLTVKDQCWNVWEFAKAYSDHILAAYRVSPEPKLKCPCEHGRPENCMEHSQEAGEIRAEVAQPCAKPPIPGPADIPCGLPNGHSGACRPDYKHQLSKVAKAGLGEGREGEKNE